MRSLGVEQAGLDPRPRALSRSVFSRGTRCPPVGRLRPVARSFPWWPPAAPGFPPPIGSHSGARASSQPCQSGSHARVSVIGLGPRVHGRGVCLLTRLGSRAQPRKSGWAASSLPRPPGPRGRFDSMKTDTVRTGAGRAGAAEGSREQPPWLLWVETFKARADFQAAHLA